MILEVLRSAGIKLKTAGKLCREDITVKPLLQSKSVTANGTVTPDSGYAGLSDVLVNVDAAASTQQAYDGSMTVEGDPVPPRPPVPKYDGSITVV